MRYLALASDYDGTLAEHGSVSQETIKALRNFRGSGRKLILVTGRELPDLERAFPNAELFDCIVAENGAVLYWPATREKRALGASPPVQFVEALRDRGVQPLGVGDVIVATWHPNEATVVDMIRDLGLELQVIFNKGAVMVLPAGINKQSGLAAGLEAMNISPHNVVGVGDAENDHAFLSYCECAVAVANALPAVKVTADIISEGHHGAGVVELINRILADDLASWEPKREHHAILLGHEQDKQVFIRPHGQSILIAGASGSGKSTFITALLEQFAEKKYQTCLIDPEGDYEEFGNAVTFGDEKHAPAVDEIAQALRKPDTQVVANLLGFDVEDRPGFFSGLLVRLQEMRLQTGHPHWIVIDEAHHLLPIEWVPSSTAFAGELKNMILITVHPDHVSPVVLRGVNVIIAIGMSPEVVVQEFSQITGVTAPELTKEIDPQSALVWMRDSRQVHYVHLVRPTAERQRHKRKYAAGELGEDRSFYFRGAEGKLNLRAQNLMLFLQLAEGVDDHTWEFHLRRGDYSRWLRDAIKDGELAEEVRYVEQNMAFDPRLSRERIRDAIQQRYTAPP